MGFKFQLRQPMRCRACWEECLWAGMKHDGGGRARGEENRNSSATSMHCSGSGCTVSCPAWKKHLCSRAWINLKITKNRAPCYSSYLFIMDTGASALGGVLSSYFRYFFLFSFYSLANWIMIEQWISNDQWSGTIFGSEGAADRKFSFRGVHDVEQSMRLLS